MSEFGVYSFAVCDDRETPLINAHEKREREDLDVAPLRPQCRFSDSLKVDKDNLANSAEEIRPDITANGSFRINPTSCHSRDRNAPAVNKATSTVCMSEFSSLILRIRTHGFKKMRVRAAQSRNVHEMSQNERRRVQDYCQGAVCFHSGDQCGRDVCTFNTTLESIHRVAAKILREATAALRPGRESEV
jgi:hypothetical protein